METDLPEPDSPTMAGIDFQRDAVHGAERAGDRLEFDDEVFYLEKGHLVYPPPFAENAKALYMQRTSDRFTEASMRQSKPKPTPVVPITGQTGPKPGY